MAEELCRIRHEIFDYATYKTDIPLEGERRYFDTILTGITHPCSVLGDGSSQCDELPFSEIIKIETDININLEILKIEGNIVLIKNTNVSSITVNLGTAGVPINHTLEAGYIQMFIYNSDGWESITSQFVEVYISDKLGIGTSDPSWRLHSVAAWPDIGGVFERTSDFIGIPMPGIIIKHTTSENMIDGFGTGISFAIEDDAGVPNYLGFVEMVRDGADDQGAFVFYTYKGDVRTEKFRLSFAGLLSVKNSIAFTEIKTIDTSSDSVDVTGISNVLCDTTSGNIIIGGFANGVEGQEIWVYKHPSANTLTLEHLEGSGTQKIITFDGADIVMATYGSVALRYIGGYWRVQGY